MTEDDDQPTQTDGGGLCPECGAGARPIVYGYPGSDLIDAVEAGEVALGGCSIGLDAPEWECEGELRHRWGAMGWGLEAGDLR